MDEDFLGIIIVTLSLILMIGVFIGVFGDSAAEIEINNANDLKVFCGQWGLIPDLPDTPYASSGYDFHCVNSTVSCDAFAVCSSWDGSNCYFTSGLCYSLVELEVI